jgi:DNA-binding transcriptional LysR family regulator
MSSQPPAPTTGRTSAAATAPENWDEIRTAYHVARAGTVSGAAEVLGVHHATVIRHVDALEARLSVRLFTRHARGYTPTEAGEDLLRVASATDDQFAQMTARLRGAGAAVTGDLIVTAIPDLTPLLVPALAALQARHAGLTVRLHTDTRLFRLEYGEAHLAIRAGARPQEPDNVVQPFWTMASGLFAAPAYAEAHGLPEDWADLARHRLIGPADDTSRVPFLRWLTDNQPPQAISFRSNDARAHESAVLAGVGIAFLPLWRAAMHPGLVPVLAPLRAWDVPLWLVTHVDLHRSSKVQQALAHLKDAAVGWPGAAPQDAAAKSAAAKSAAD